MSAILKVETIEQSNGSPVQLTGQSAAKLWAVVSFDGGTPSLGASFNISTITDTAAGQVTYNMANTMSTIHYSILGMTKGDGTNTYLYSTERFDHTRTLMQFQVCSLHYNAGSPGDPSVQNTIAHGELV